MFRWMHGLSHLPYCITAPMTLMYDQCMFMALNQQNKRKTLIYHIRANKHVNNGIESQKHTKRSIHKHSM